MGVSTIHGVAARHRLAERAAVLVPPGRVTVATTGGAATAAVRALLARRRGLTLVTTALTPVLAIRGGAKVVLTGGAVRDPAQGCVGEAAEAALRARPIDIAVVSVDGVDHDGLSAADPEQASLIRTLVHHARRVVALADHSALGRAEAARIAPLTSVHDIVTDACALPPTFTDPCPRFHLAATGLRS
ncbi:hypothetical protein GCM10022247_55240 [Allokutzneria multivorans]|uniref:DeoR-like transcriptional repressor C-terminal sensor domain-containing protein n=1 Tax=Allokutzneria multivorans TaxID=1142134 RepID=A0ABP7TB55_9PSEU